MSSRWPLLILRSVGQGHCGRDKHITKTSFLHLCCRSIRTCLRFRDVNKKRREAVHSSHRMLLIPCTSSPMLPSPHYWLVKILPELSHRYVDVDTEINQGGLHFPVVVLILWLWWRSFHNWFYDLTWNDSYFFNTIKL